MSVPLAFVVVIVVWTTTPLAIQWSSDGPGHLFGLTIRMAIGASLALLLVGLLRRRMPLHRQALKTYLAAGLGLYSAMSLVYWASLYVPSGWVAVIFGLTPLMTGILAHYWLHDEALTWLRSASIALGLGGLWVIFAERDSVTQESMLIWGMAAVTLSAFIHAASAVAVKRINAGIDGLSTTTGALLIALPFYGMTWLLSGEGWPSEIPVKAIMSIVYLGVFGSVLGFILYYHLLKHTSASRVALITLVTPVTALLLGQWLNQEVVTLKIWLGTALIVTGLGMHQFSEARA